MEKYYGENVEPQHKMYWNFFLKGRQNAQYIVEPQHKMYWNHSHSAQWIKTLLLNRNIRCIEIIVFYLRKMDCTLLNRNIRCIEIKKDFGKKVVLNVEPQHKMYWNPPFYRIFEILYKVEPQHKMYWNLKMRFLLLIIVVRWTAT